MKRFVNWWTLTISTSIVVMLCLALGLPIFVHATRPWWIRLLLVALTGLVWAGFALFRLLHARMASDAIAAQITADVDPRDEEARRLAARMKDALKAIRHNGVARSDYLYSRPWYVIVGPPGSGKTTALVNSGVRFPHSDSEFSGVGGTRDLDFHFADEAVFVDTAGRYTTQDSDAAVDARGWLAFLGLLRRRRPLQPINGVVVALPLDELRRVDRAGLDSHATAVRRRLAEIRTVLKVNPPVYVLFTKADLIEGFIEYFDDLDVEGRRAVVGATLSTQDPPNATQLTTEFDLLATSIADRSAKRLQEERDSSRRSLILGFPSQILSLRARILRFLDGAFPANGESGLLRGFYFTSGVQQGLPIDRLLGATAEVFGHDAGVAGRGRAYFLNRLLEQVMFPEAGLVQEDRGARARRRVALTAALSGMGAMTVAVAAVWLISFVVNLDLQKRLKVAAAKTSADIGTARLNLVNVSQEPELKDTLPILDELRALPSGYDDRQAKRRPAISGFGLYQEDQSRRAEHAYLEGLERIMLPRLILRLEDYLRQPTTDPINAYEALKVYLMLAGQSSGHFQPDTIYSWVVHDWETESLSGSDNQPVRESLAKHLKALLKHGETSEIWPGRVAPADGALIDSARVKAASMPLADRAYAILRQRAQTAGPAWRAGDGVLNPGDAPAFANGMAVLDLSVPFIFTKDGYEKVYRSSLEGMPIELARDKWVMGPYANTLSSQGQMAQLKNGVASHYAADYIAAWENVVKGLKPADYFHTPAALGVFARESSPWKTVLLEVKKNTNYGSGPASKTAGRLLYTYSPTASRVVKFGQAEQTATMDLDAGRQISMRFKDLNDYVGDGQGHGQIDEFIEAVKNAFTATGASTAEIGGQSQAGDMMKSVNALRTAAAGAPALLRDFVDQTVQAASGASVTSAHGAVADAYSQTLAHACQAATQDRYPFVRTAKSDASATQLTQVFGVNQGFDAFARGSILPLLDKSGAVWRWRSGDPLGSSFHQESAEEFRKAAEVGALLSTGVAVRIEGVGFGGGVTAVEVALGGAKARFETAKSAPKLIRWSIQAPPEAEVRLLEGTNPVKTYQAQGDWALFHLLDQASPSEPLGSSAARFTFGGGNTFATLKLTVVDGPNPFTRGAGPWSFRCPATL